MVDAQIGINRLVICLDDEENSSFLELKENRI
jgi:hypothetical protein